MQQNTCYEDHTVYEEVQLQDKEVQLQDKEVQLQDKTEMRLKPNEKISSSNADKINRLTSKKETNLKAKCCLIVVLAIAMVAAIALSAYALVSSNQGMDSFMLDFQELKMQLNKTKEASETEIAKLKRALETNGVNTLTATNNATMALLNSLQSSVSSLNTANATTTHLNSLQSAVSSLNTTNGATATQLNSLQSSVTSLNTANEATTTRLNSLQSSVSSLNTANEATTTQLNSLQSSVNSLNTANEATTTQFNNLQSSVNSLTTRVNSPVNLYQNCIQETRSCTNTQSSDYLKTCVTSTLPVNKSVSC